MYNTRRPKHCCHRPPNLVPRPGAQYGERHPEPKALMSPEPPPRPCSPSPHCSHYILITSEDYPRPRHAQRISSSNFRDDVIDIRASTTTRRRQRSLRYRRLCRRPLYNRTKTRKTKRHFFCNLLLILQSLPPPSHLRDGSAGPRSRTSTSGHLSGSSCPLSPSWEYPGRE